MCKIKKTLKIKFALYFILRPIVDDKKYTEFFQTLGCRFITGRGYNANTLSGDRDCSLPMSVICSSLQIKLKHNSF